MDSVIVAFLQFLALLVGTGALIVMLILLVIALIQAGPAMNAREWTSAKGMIIKSFVSSAADDENPKSARVWYVPNVAYTYFADGTQYVAQRLYFGAPAKSAARDQAEKQLAAYPVGALVTVFYNPDAPATATLERRAPNATKLLWFAAALFLGGLFACSAGLWLPNWIH